MTKVESNDTDKLGKEYFQLPIYHLADKIETDENIISDLELTEYKDASDNNVYSDTFRPTTTYGKELCKKWSKYYTTNRQFLKIHKIFIRTTPNLAFMIRIDLRK